MDSTLPRGDDVGDEVEVARGEESHGEARSGDESAVGSPAGSQVDSGAARLPVPLRPLLGDETVDDGEEEDSGLGATFRVAAPSQRGERPYGGHPLGALPLGLLSPLGRQLDRPSEIVDQGIEVSDDVWEIGTLRDHRQEGGQILYKIGWITGEVTWDSAAEVVADCPDGQRWLDEYHEAIGGKPVPETKGGAGAYVADPGAGGDQMEGAGASVERRQGNLGARRARGLQSDESQEQEQTGGVEDKYSYAQYYKHGRWLVSHQAWSQERWFHPALADVKKEYWHLFSMQLFYAMEDKLLELLLDGNVQLATKQDPQVRRLLGELEGRSAHDHWCPYLYEFVKPNGESPTPRELLRVMDAAELYLQNTPEVHDLVRKVDTWRLASKFRNTELRDGKRRYLLTRPAAANLRELLKATRAMLAQEPIDEPLRQPLREAGYAKNGPKRIHQHERHDSSKYPMNLFEAIAGGYAGVNWRMCSAERTPVAACGRVDEV